MIDEERCPHGAPGCDCREAQGLTLVGVIMRSIEQYNRTGEAEPCPGCLRDALLAVAALLHLKAAHLDSADAGGKRALDADFANAARQRMSDVVLAVAGPVSGFRQ
jgi:hypothetical protein